MRFPLSHHISSDGLLLADATYRSVISMTLNFDKLARQYDGEETSRWPVFPGTKEKSDTPGCSAFFNLTFTLIYYYYCLYIRPLVHTSCSATSNQRTLSFDDLSGDTIKEGGYASGNREKESTHIREG